MTKKKVADDAGHGMSNVTTGKKDPGAVDPKDPKKSDNIWTSEATINQIMSDIFEKQLEAGSYPVVNLVGKLTARANKANQEKVSAGISWHCDAGPETARGLTLYIRGDSRSFRLATLVQLELSPILQKFGIKFRGIKEHPKHLVMLNATDAPWILIEIGFITNTTEEKVINDPKYQWAIGSAVARGYVRFLG
jgi:N-acetylmuramoyl-L-alanine amidase